MRRILSIDGGGLRGSLIACFLLAVESQLGKLCREIFDMVAGTSTGALIAAAVAAGVPAARILGIYRDRSKEIFPFPATGLRGWAERGEKGYAYDPKVVRKILVEEFGAASAWLINDSPIRMLLTAKGVDQHPWYFVQDRPKNAKVTGACPMVDCAVASAMAPTYFPPWYVPPGEQLVGWCFDGGTGVAGNPVLEACIEAFEYDDFDPKDTLAASFGTGYYPDGERNPPGDGLLGAITWTIDSLVEAPIDQQIRVAKLLYPGVVQRYNWKLPANVDMSDVAEVPTWIALGTKLAAEVDWRKELKL